jgi:hypothetical protein
MEGIIMDDICIYQVDIQGKISASDFNSFSPPDLSVEWQDESTRLSFHADQAGLIGFIRHLHACGFRILFLQAVEINKN